MKAGLLGYCLDQKTKDVELKVLIIRNWEGEQSKY